jgi:hypothetical protein
MVKMAGSIVAKLGRFSNELGKGQFVPTQRFIAWAMRGMVAAKSVVLADIGRSLFEGYSSLHQVEKRLSYHLANPRWDHEWSQDTYLAHVARWIGPDTFIAVDMGDITKPRARSMPYLDVVWDGSKQGTREEKRGVGWWKVEIEAMPKQRGKLFHLPLEDRVFSGKEPGFRSQNEVIFSTIDRVLAYTGHNGIWLEDRGFDGESNLQFLLSRELRFVVRSQGERNASVGQKTMRIREWARNLRLTPATCLIRRKHRHALRIGYCGVRLTFTSVPITLVVCEGFGLKPLLFLTNIEVGNLTKATELVEAYLARWGVEEGCRFVKQTFDLENLRALTWMGIRRLTYMALWCYGFLCLLALTAAQRTFDALVRIFPSFGPTPKFFFYRLAEAVSALLGPPIWAPNGSGT